MKLKAAIPALILGCCLLMSIHSTQAAPIEISAGEIQIKSKQYNQQGTVKITGPEGFYQEYTLSEGQDRLPLYQLDLKQDGLYSYEIMLVTTLGQETVNDPSNGRVNAVRNTVSSEKLSGNFRLQGGDFVAPTEETSVGTIEKEYGVEHEH